MFTTTIYRLAARLASKRYAGAIVLCAAAIVLLVNELTYHRTRQLLSSGIELTDARIATAHVLQLLRMRKPANAGMSSRSNYLSSNRTKKRWWPYRRFAAISSATLRQPALRASHLRRRPTA